MIYDDEEEDKTVEELGNVVFRDNWRMEEIKKELGAVVSICGLGKWDLSDERYRLWDLPAIFPIIRQLRIKQLYLNRIQNPFIIPTIASIQLQTLTVLALQSNNIVSLEPLLLMRIPQLNVLWLAYNRITSVRSLRKMQLPELQWLSLHNNPIRDFHFICQLKAENLATFDFGCLDVLEEGIRTELIWMKKMESQLIIQSYG